MSLAASYAISAIFSAKDKLSPVVTKIEKRYGSMAGKVARSLNKMNKVINKVLKVGATAALAATIAFTAMATKEFIALDDAVVQAGAKFKDLDTKSENYAQSLDALSAKSREVASVTEFMASDAAGALDKMAMAGLASDVSMSLLMGTTNLATAAGSDLTTAVDIATDSMGAFNMSMDNAADAEKNLNRISDVFAKTTTTANTDLLMLAESVGAGASAFTTAGQEMETFAAFTGILANSMLKGGAAGTSLRNVMLRLAKPTGEAAALIEKLDVKTADSDGNFRDVVDILADLENGLKGMGTQQKTAALATIFGAKTQTGINLLLAEGSDELRKYRAELKDSAGASQKMADAIRASLGNQLKILKSSVMELGLQFVDSFEKEGRGGLQRLIETAQNFDMTPVTASVEKLIELGKEWGPTFIDFAPMVLKIAAAIKAWSIAQGLLNAGLLSSPLGAFVVSATALMVLLKAAEAKFGLGEKIAEERGGGIYSRDFEEDRRRRLAERQAAAAALDPRRKRLMERNRSDRDELRAERNRNRLELAPNAAEEQSKQAQILKGEGTITVKAEDGTTAEVDTGTMGGTGWDMAALGKDGLAS